MNIDENYKGCVRIVGQPRNPESYPVMLYDIETGEQINNVVSALISLDVAELITITQLTYYPMTEKGTCLLDSNDQPIKKTIQITRPEIDITALMDAHD